MLVGISHPSYNYYLTLLLMPPHHPSSAAGPLQCRAGGCYTSEWWSKGLVYTAVAPRREKSRSFSQISVHGSSLLETSLACTHHTVVITKDVLDISRCPQGQSHSSQEAPINSNRTVCQALGLPVRPSQAVTKCSGSVSADRCNGVTCVSGLQILLLCSTWSKWTSWCRAWLEMSIGSGRGHSSLETSAPSSACELNLWET